MISHRCYCYFWILKFFKIESVLEIYVLIVSALHLQYQMNKGNDFYVWYWFLVTNFELSRYNEYSLLLTR